ncbi:hypothetical protein CLU79DRAFT_747705 [Phycomyces nitens]|nr:hypothetical protein CLU79DRAFT_747705 [Phycomyces nitens]
MRKSAAHLKDASTLLFTSRTSHSQRPLVASCCWDTHLRALLDAFDSPLLPGKIPRREPVRWFRTRLPKMRAFSTAVASAPEDNCTTNSQNPINNTTQTTITTTRKSSTIAPRQLGETPATLEGALSVFNLSKRVMLEDLEVAIRNQQAEKAWSLFMTLASRDDVECVPLSLCSGLFSLMVYCQTLSGHGGVFEYRQSQIDQVLDYVEQTYEQPIDLFIDSCKVIPIPNHKRLHKAIREQKTHEAWDIYCSMKNDPLSSIKLIPRKTCWKLLSLIQTGRNISRHERLERIAFVANIHSGREENGRCLVGADFIPLAKIYHLYNIKKTRNAQTAIRNYLDTKPGSVDALDELIWIVLQFGELKFAGELLKEFEKTKQLKEQMYVNLIQAHRSRRQYEDGLAVFGELLNAGVEPQTRSFNAILQIFAEQGMSERASGILETMVALSVVPDVATYSEVIRAYANANQMRECIRYYVKMQQQSVVPNVYTYSILIEGFSKRGDVPQVIRWFQLMLDNGIQPNEVAITSVLKAFRHTPHPNIAEAVQRISHNADAAGAKGDSVLYTILLKIRSNISGPHGALVLHRKMLSRYVTPNVFTYTLLIDVCGKNHMPDTAQKIFELMKTSTHNKPNTATYTAIISAWMRARRRDMVDVLVQEFKTEYSRSKDSQHHGQLWMDSRIEAHLDHSGE